MAQDILERLRETPTVTLPQVKAMIPVAQAIRRMMVERAEAADEIERLRARAGRSTAPSAVVLASLKEAVAILDFAFEQGALSDDQIMGLYVDPWGALRDMKAALAQAESGKPTP